MFTLSAIQKFHCNENYFLRVNKTDDFDVDEKNEEPVMIDILRNSISCHIELDLSTRKSMVPKNFFNEPFCDTKVRKPTVNWKFYDEILLAYEDECQESDTKVMMSCGHFTLQKKHTNFVETRHYKNARI